MVSFHNATVQPRVFANSDFEEVLSQLVEVKKVKFSVLDMQYMSCLKVANSFRYAERTDDLKLHLYAASQILPVCCHW